MASALEPTHGTGAFMGYLTDDGKGSQPKADVPNKIGNSYSDFLASLTAELAVLASLMHRSRTGKGMWIDLAMYQVGVSFVGEGVLDYAFNERRTRRMGNRHESMAPHGCYPCVGDDEWVAIAVRNDSDWAAMCQAMESPSLAVDTRFAHAKSRLQRQEKLDAIVSEWTATQDQYQVMDRLQGVGVPAGPVLNARGLLTDPHIRERRLFEPADHPEVTGLGRREYLGRGWKLSGSEVKVRGPAPILGEGNEYVLGEVMGLGADEIQALRDEGAIGEHPIGATTPGAVSLERQVELGWTVSYDPEFRQILGGAG
jgi:crotonobetainyl-CoA:carnitine CoA-transferase CaiB-like acyl-CoA transferase